MKADDPTAALLSGVNRNISMHKLADMSLFMTEHSAVCALPRSSSASQLPDPRKRCTVAGSGNSTLSPTSAGANDGGLKPTIVVARNSIANVEINQRRSFQYGTSQRPKRSTVAAELHFDKDRETWAKKMDFLLSVIGFAVDLSNVWRFPYLCFKNGGGAFLIPYLIMYAVGGVPLFFMELALGQYHRKGAITCWSRVVPLFKGIGYSVVLIAFYVDLYYNVIIAWAMHFFIKSFSSPLPWSKCNNPWNTEKCFEINEHMNFSALNQTAGENQTSLISHSAAVEYFNREFLQFHKSSGIYDLGEVRWDIALSLLTVYLICYFSLWKGISTSGKVVWFTALFPYVVLLILLVRGIFLPGALDGIRYYLTPDFRALYDANVWFDAATQVFFSLGPGFGVLLAFASYNKFHNNVHRDALITSAINSGTSFLAGFVIFAVLGYMAKKLNVEVKEIAAEGPGLVFIVYPEAISAMPAGPVWAVIFFLMLLTLGLDSSFGGSEAIITAISDEYPLVKRNRETFVALLFGFYFIVGLASCTQGGVYIVHFMDKFAAGYSILFAVLFEAIAVSWIYGVRRFSQDIKLMVGFEVHGWWRFCWAIMAPVFIIIIIISGLINYEPLKYNEYEYPWWVNLVGFLLAASSVLCIPLAALHQLLKTPGTFTERIKTLLTPYEEERRELLMLRIANISKSTDTMHAINNNNTNNNTNNNNSPISRV